MAEATPYDLLPVKSDEDWHAIRATGIGGSDAAAVLGLSPFKSRLKLWLEKTGAEPAEDLSELKHIKWGNLLEPVLAAEYARQHPNVKIRRKTGVLRSKAHPFMLATLDRTVNCKDRGRGGLEIKTAGFFPGQKWGSDGCDDEDAVPVGYQIQTQHYLAVTGFDFFDVAVLIGGQDDRYYTINRDQDLIDAMIEAEAVFWQMVQDGTMPALTGHTDESGALLAMFPNGSEEVLDLSSTVAVDLTAQFLVQHVAENSAKAMKKKLASEIKALMGDHSKATVGDGGPVINWSKFDKRDTDMDGIRAEVPDVVARHTTLKPSSRFTITPPKATN